MIASVNNLLDSHALCPRKFAFWQFVFGGPYLYRGEPSWGEYMGFVAHLSFYILRAWWLLGFYVW